MNACVSFRGILFEHWIICNYVPIENVSFFVFASLFHLPKILTHIDKKNYKHKRDQIPNIRAFKNGCREVLICVRYFFKLCIKRDYTFTILNSFLVLIGLNALARAFDMNVSKWNEHIEHAGRELWCFITVNTLKISYIQSLSIGNINSIAIMTTKCVMAMVDLNFGVLFDMHIEICWATNRTPTYQTNAVIFIKRSALDYYFMLATMLKCFADSLHPKCARIYRMMDSFRKCFIARVFYWRIQIIVISWISNVCLVSVLKTGSASNST